MDRRRRIALMLDLEWPYRWHTDVFVGALRYARERGWEAIIDEFADDTLRRSPNKQPAYDGIIARATRKLARQAAERNVPLVNVWVTSPVWRSVPSVFSDRETVGRMYAEHLLDRGLKRFASLVSEDDRSHAFALRGFDRVLRRAGCQNVIAKLPREASANLSNWRKTVRRLTRWFNQFEPPLGVWAGAESEGWVITQFCHERGWNVPRDVALIAGFNEPLYCEQNSPTLTSAELGNSRVGYEAGALLERLMDGDPPPTSPILLPPVGLIVRESTDFMTASDPIIATALAYIAGHSHLPIGPDDVSQAASVGRRTLERRFIKHLARPIAAEIRRVRIERAKRELTQSGRSLAQIAHDVGFGPPESMHQVFERELGVTPSEYRRRRLLPQR